MLGGIVLTGGASRRLGADKASLRLDGETLAVRAARMLEACCDTAIEVGPGHTGLDSVRESPPGSGPLAALAVGAAALLGRGALGGVLLLACDLPHASPALGALVAAPPAAVVVPVDATGRRQYVCARYGPGVVLQAIELADRGTRALHELVATVPDADVVELTGFAPEVLADVDTAADARRLGIPVPPVASDP